ncbi:MAG: hypothetical protein Q8M16_09470 [Pirellulaceae bacterium]|nr:hypothetical protein [Pirellulaceae bacterium]
MENLSTLTFWTRLSRIFCVICVAFAVWMVTDMFLRLTQREPFLSDNSRTAIHDGLGSPATESLSSDLTQTGPSFLDHATSGYWQFQQATVRLGSQTIDRSRWPEHAQRYMALPPNLDIDFSSIVADLGDWSFKSIGDESEQHRHYLWEFGELQISFVVRYHERRWLWCGGGMAVPVSPQETIVYELLGVNELPQQDKSTSLTPVVSIPFGHKLVANRLTSNGNVMASVVTFDVPLSAAWAEIQAANDLVFEGQAISAGSSQQVVLACPTTGQRFGGWATRLGSANNFLLLYELQPPVELRTAN